MNTKPVSLEASLDLGAARHLLEEMRSARGHHVDVDASCVVRLGAPCLQVLLAAQAAWRADKLRFRILDPSESFLDGINLMGAGELMTAGETL